MNERLSLQDLIDLLAKKQEITKKDAESFLRELIVVVSENIENNEPVKIKDFGVFKLVKINARRSVDVNTGEAIEIAAHYKLSFTPDKLLKEAINRPFAHFESVILEEGVSFEVEKEEAIELENPEDVAVDEMDKPDEQSIEVAVSPVALQDSVNDISKTEHTEELVHPVAEIIEHKSSENIISEDIIEEPQDMPVQGEVLPIESVPSVAEIEQQEEELKAAALPEDMIDTDELEATQEEEKRASKKRKRLVSLGFFIFLIIASFLAGGLYFQEIERFLTEGLTDENKIAVVEKEKKLNEALIAADSLTNKMDSSQVNIVKDSLMISDKGGISRDNTRTESTTTTTLATITIEPGSTLRNIALKYYGHKSFWVYIYEENKDKIRNANNVPLGTELVIPDPIKYGINPQNEASVDTARQRERKLFSEMGL